jgi:hypothetical protein
MSFPKWIVLSLLPLIFSISIPSAAKGEEWDRQICWKNTQTRGGGKVPICDDNHEKDAGLCYKPCRDGYKGVGPVCWKECPHGYHDDGATCRRDAHIFGKKSYGRGVGKPLPCRDGKERDAGLCYRKCREGYRGAGPVCWQQCPKGYHNDGATCRRDAHIFGKESYGRGVGAVPKNCPSGQHYDAGLCYPECKTGYKSVGPVCWQECDHVSVEGVPMHHSCGAACSTNKKACGKWASAWVVEGFGIIGDAVQSIDSSKVAELIDAVKKYPANIPKCP